jgi:vacuolar-type H+-ATPase subunit I/STV1
MKAFLKVVLLLVVSSSVWAISPEAEDKRFLPVDVRKSIAEDSLFNAWFAKLGNPVVMEEAGVQLVLHDHLATSFYLIAKNNGWLPKGAEQEAVYVRSWLRVNGMRSGYSTAAEFRQFLGKNGQLRLLTEADLSNGTSTAAPVVVASTVSVPAPKAAVPAAEVDAAKLTALAKQLTTMQQQVEKGGQSVQSLQEQITTFKRQLGTVNTAGVAIQKSVRDLMAGLQALRDEGLTEKRMKEINARVDVNLAGLTGRVERTENAMQGLSDKVDAMEEMASPKRSLVYLALFALFTGVTIVVLQWRQRQVNQQVDIKFERVDKLDRKVGDLQRLVRGIDGKGGLVGDLANTNSRVDGLASDVLEVQDNLAIIGATAAVEFDSGNPGLEELETLPVGDEHAVFWKGRIATEDGHADVHFMVKIWREETTPAGQVQTNVVRNADSGQQAEPIALKRLKKRIEAAVLDGRVPTFKLAAVAA